MEDNIFCDILDAVVVSKLLLSELYVCFSEKWIFST